MTEIITPGDPRASSTEMTAGKKAETKTLLKRGTFKVIFKEELPANGDIPCGRFVLAITFTEDGKIKCKAKYVIRGHHDK